MTGKRLVRSKVVSQSGPRNIKIDNKNKISTINDPKQKEKYLPIIVDYTPKIENYL